MSRNTKKRVKILETKVEVLTGLVNALLEKECNVKIEWDPSFEAPDSHPES